MTPLSLKMLVRGVLAVLTLKPSEDKKERPYNKVILAEIRQSLTRVRADLVRIFVLAGELDQEGTPSHAIGWVGDYDAASEDYKCSVQVIHASQCTGTLTLVRRMYDTKCGWANVDYKLFVCAFNSGHPSEEVKLLFPELTEEEHDDLHGLACLSADMSLTTEVSVSA